jgi:hypothetical protein
MLLAVLTMLWGCSSDSDDGDKLEGSSFAPVEKPSWTIDMMANDPVPTWQAPDPSKYESSMIIWCVSKSSWHVTPVTTTR